MCLPFVIRDFGSDFLRSQMVVAYVPVYFKKQTFSNKDINEEQKNKLLSALDSFRCSCVGSFSN